MNIPIALTIAGSDSGGGAGIQADLKTFSALGVFGASVITALTAQNTKGVTGIHDVPADFITAQMDAVFSDLDVKAVKIGMVAARGDRRHCRGPRPLVAAACRVRSGDGRNIGDRLLSPMPSMPCARALSACTPDYAEPAGSRRLLNESIAERAGDRTAGQAIACSWCA
jgi:hydroxymethylpyrimidine/phosphomethylpyrimidine kinase